MSTNPQPPQPGSGNQQPLASQADSPNSQPDSIGPQPPGDPLDPARLKLALKAFKKRLKMVNLDHDSRLGHGPMSSGGRGASIVAIVPPSNYPPAVWDELARLGKLRRAGQGMYELGDQT